MGGFLDCLSMKCWSNLVASLLSCFASEFSEPLRLLISDSRTPASSSTAVHAFTDSYIYIFTYRYISGGLKRLVILGNLL